MLARLPWLYLKSHSAAGVRPPPPSKLHASMPSMVGMEHCEAGGQDRDFDTPCGKMLIDSIIEIVTGS